MKNILVLVDLKKEPEQLLKSAMKIGRQLEAKIILANLQPALSVVAELHGTEGILMEESYPAIEALVDFKKTSAACNEFNQHIECTDLKIKDPGALKDFVIKNNICIIIQYMPPIIEFDAQAVKDAILKIVNHMNCPCLFLPFGPSFKQIDRIAYFTDLRYCDLGVVRLLKSFNAFLFITHVTIQGLPDISHQYAHDIISDEIAAKSGYKKIFLRNVKRANHLNEIEKIIEVDDVNLCAMVSKKHGLLEEVLPAKSGGIKHLYSLPLLIIPFLNWFICNV